MTVSPDGKTMKSFTDFKLSPGKVESTLIKQ
jgi:hypothetical protein